MQTTLEHARAEFQLATASEQRVMQENKTLIEERRSQAGLLASLQTIQNNAKRAENEAKLRLEGQVRLQLSRACVCVCERESVCVRGR